MVSVIAANPIAQMILAARNSDDGLKREAGDDGVDDIESRPRSAERKICEMAIAMHTIVKAMKEPTKGVPNAPSKCEARYGPNTPPAMPAPVFMATARVRWPADFTAWVAADRECWLNPLKGPSRNVRRTGMANRCRKSAAADINPPAIP